MSHEEFMAEMQRLHAEIRVTRSMLGMFPDSDDEELEPDGDDVPGGDDDAWEDFLAAHAELGPSPLEFTDQELHVAIGEARKRHFRRMIEMQWPWGDPIHPNYQADPGASARDIAQALGAPVSKSDVGRVVGRLMRLEREGVVSRTPTRWGFSLWRWEADDA